MRICLIFLANITLHYRSQFRVIDVLKRGKYLFVPRDLGGKSPLNLDTNYLFVKLMYIYYVRNI